MENATATTGTPAQNGAQTNTTGAAIASDKILETSYAFVKTLEMENDIFQKQLEGIVQMALDVAQKVIILRKMEEKTDFVAENTDPLRVLESLKEQVAERARSAGSNASPAPSLTAAITTAGQSEDVLATAVAQSISLSYQNAVNAQQQMYITMQAATTMAITTILNVDTAADENHTNHTL